MAECSSKTFKAVVAFDIGTTYSGYAFITKYDYDRNPMQIHTTQCFVARESRLLSQKTSSSLLLDKDKKFLSFGFDAESTYLDSKEKHELYFFHRFKMNLYKTKDISSKLQLSDITKKKSLPAIDVFSLSIEALKDKFLANVKSKNLQDEYPTEKILWVITVPAIWSPGARIFMMESAKKAGLDEKQICIALEPEAGAIYCQQKVDFKLSEPGTTYLVADLGGGTADLTVHERLQDGGLKELHKASGIDSGGTDVDKKFLEFFSELTETKDILSVLSAESNLDLHTTIEILKRRVKHEDDKDITVDMPDLFTADERDLKENIQELANKYCERHGQDIITKRTGRKLAVNASLLKSFFYDTVDRIIHIIQSVLDKCKSSKSVGVILLVGGFSESTVVVQRIRDFFKDKTVIAPTNAELAIVQGAVMYGFDNEIIISRILTHSYGQNICREFDASKDEGRETITRDGRVYCKGVFNEIVAAGDEIKRGDEKAIVLGTLSDFQPAVMSKFYACPNRTPDYVDDPDCTEIGSVLIPLLVPLPAGRPILLAIKFGGTVIEVTAMDGLIPIPISTTLKLKD